MRILKTCLNIVGASLIQGTVISAPDIEGTLVQTNEKGDCVVNPIFQPEIVNQLHYLIKRSYRITDRHENAYNYRYPEKLTHRRSNSFGKTTEEQSCSSSEGGAEKPELHYDKWIIHAPFTGTHGVEQLRGLVGKMYKIPCAVELDYPGFVAYLPREGERPPLIVVVFRGSQPKSFQPLGGLLGPSWLTNFSAAKEKFPEGVENSEDLAGVCFHSGFLRKYLSARVNILAHIETMLLEIPEADRPNARIIFTGHSQGAGVALPAALDVTHVLGEKYFGADFDNKVTPRFFVYALSGPNSTGDDKTKEIMNAIIGRDNIIRHNSLFDIVTYACPGKRFDSEFCKAVFGTLAGVETGYHPVGHLAVDDIKSLMYRGFKYNGKKLEDRDWENIWKHLSKGYSKAIQKRQLEGGVMNYIRSFYMSVQECSCLLKGACEADGPYFFAYINHYGSSTANICCSPESKRRSLCIMPGDPSQRLITPTHHGSSFEPRLPESDLNPCLFRGQRNRELVMNEVVFENPEQVFSSDFPSPQTICYDAYESDSEDL